MLQHWLDLFGYILCNIKLLLVYSIEISSIELIYRLYNSTSCDYNMCCLIGFRVLAGIDRTVGLGGVHEQPITGKICYSPTTYIAETKYAPSYNLHS